MSLIIAIDVGIKNLGLCAYDMLTNQVEYWANTPLCDSRYLPANNVRYVREFVRKHRDLFERALTVLVERQMRTNMRIVEAVFESLYFDKCIVLSPRAVKQHYGLCTRNYRGNKQKAVEWASEFVTNNSGTFKEGALKGFESGSKRDDLADSLLLLMFYLDTYSEQLGHQ